MSSLKEDLAKADQQLRSMVGKPILNGRDSVRKVLDTFKARGGREAEVARHYHGPVIENFECEKSIYTAVEVGLNQSNCNGIRFYLIIYFVGNCW